MPLRYSDFQDYPSFFVANRSHGKLHDEHIAIASVNRTTENDDQPPRNVFLGLKLTGFRYSPPSKIGNSTHESIFFSRLDLLVTLSSSRNGDKPRIEELSLSCDFDASLDAQIRHTIINPFLYNLQLIESINWYASPLEPFISWKGVDNYEIAGVIDFWPIDFVYVLHNDSPIPECILTLTLTYSFDSSAKQQTSTSLYIAVTD